MINEVMGKSESLACVNLYDMLDAWRKRNAKTKEDHRAYG
jgi:hypothetical protein